jgi:hypothetical protein
VDHLGDGVAVGQRCAGAAAAQDAGDLVSDCGVSGGEVEQGAGVVELGLRLLPGGEAGAA